MSTRRRSCSRHQCLSKTFAMKSCTNPARHIFPWLTGEGVSLHAGGLSKMFAMLEWQLVVSKMPLLTVIRVRLLSK